MPLLLPKRLFTTRWVKCILFGKHRAGRSACNPHNPCDCARERIVGIAHTEGVTPQGGRWFCKQDSGFPTIPRVSNGVRWTAVPRRLKGLNLVADDKSHVQGITVKVGVRTPADA